jgi:hypothetical protein
MKNVGDKVQYQSVHYGVGPVVAILPGALVEVAVPSVGWLSKPNKVIPLSQVLGGVVGVGGVVSYCTVSVVGATVKRVYPGALDVAPDFNPGMSLLVSDSMLV